MMNLERTSSTSKEAVIGSIPRLSRTHVDVDFASIIFSANDGFLLPDLVDTEVRRFETSAR